MKEGVKSKSPKALADLTHLFFSNASAKQKAKAAPPVKIIPPGSGKTSSGGNASAVSRPLQSNRALDRRSVMQALCRGAARLHEGARLVEEEPRQPHAVDLIFTDPAGRLIFYDLVWENPRDIPYRVFDRLSWLTRNGPLFLRAFKADGIRTLKDPLLVFLAPSFPKEVVQALAAVQEASVRLLQVVPLSLEGNRGILLREYSAEKTACFLPLS